MNADYTKVAEMLKDIKVAMLTTVSKNDELHSRPMMAKELDETGALWFFTSKETGKVQSIEQDQRVNLAYASTKDGKYVSVGGHANIIKDDAKAKELWTTGMKSWFPEGATESDLVLIKVQVDSAEYWDTPNGKMVQLIKMAKTMIQGERYQASKEEHGRVDLH